MNSPHFFDSREVRDPVVREADLMARLAAQVAYAKGHSAAYGKVLASIDPAAVNSREALARLPVVRKSELFEMQKAARPFGGFAAAGRALQKVFASPGPIYEPEGHGHEYQRMARALYAIGFRQGDLIHNSFSYHMTPGGWILDAGATALGCTVFPAGVGNTEQQVAAMLDLQPVGYCGTPSFLRILLEKADELGTPITSLKRAAVSGEAYLPPQRKAFLDRGIAGYQAYATAELGLIAYESPAPDGSALGMLIDEDLIVEIVRPGTGDPVPEGDVGEVVVTNFNLDYPLIRFGTGDLSAMLPGLSACGRTAKRIKGWMGRADQTTKVKGMFVHPAQVADVLRKHPELGRARLVVTNPDARDYMVLRVECAEPSDALRAAVVASLRDATKLGGDAEFVAVGGLPNDGKVIDDQRAVA